MRPEAPYLLSEHPGGGEGYVFLLSAISFRRVNGREEGVGSLRRNGIRRQGVFFGVHFYIVRVLCVIECNRWATKLRLWRTCEKCGLAQTQVTEMPEGIRKTMRRVISC